LVIQYRDRETGDQKTYKIGRWPAVKVERGREVARKLRAKIEEGFDPQGDRAAKRAEATVNDLADRFEREHLPRKRPSTAENYARLLRLYIRPHLGRTRVSAVERADVERMLRDVTEVAGPYQSNRVHGVGSKLFSTAMRWSLLSPAQGNPFQGIERHKEHHRRRYASADEVRRLVAALAQHPDRQSADAIKLLLLTGARRGEVLSMRWADVDLDAATWSRKAVDLKQGRDHALPLSAPAIAILSAIRDEQSGKGKRALGEWVFPSAASKSKHLVAIRRLWRNVVKTAELGDLRLHDIRHTVASQLVSSGASLALVGSLLGHSSPQITARYAHLIDTVEREAVGKIGAWVEAAGGAPTPPEPPPSGDVIKSPRPRRDPS
jgi:integrase